MGYCETNKKIETMLIISAITIILPLLYIAGKVLTAIIKKLIK